MRWNRHSEIEGRHAFLSASKYHWLRYSPEDLIDKYNNSMNAAYGTRLHAWASETIRLGIKQIESHQTLNMYINDAIGFRMEVEQPLVYTENAFGTADAICFRMDPETERFVLRIFDLKNGVNKASGDQLLVYAAFFCLEYKIRPAEIDYDLRIYQNDEIFPIEVTHEDVTQAMGIVVAHDKLIKNYNDRMGV